MLTLIQKLEADISEMEYLTNVLKSQLNWDKENRTDYFKKPLRIQGVIDDLELVKRSLKKQIKY